MGTTELLILVVVLLVLFGGGGGYYWRRGRRLMRLVTAIATSPREASNQCFKGRVDELVAVAAAGFPAFVTKTIRCTTEIPQARRTLW